MATNRREMNGGGLNSWAERPAPNAPDTCEGRRRNDGRPCGAPRRDTRAPQLIQPTSTMTPDDTHLGAARGPVITCRANARGDYLTRVSATQQPWGQWCAVVCNSTSNWRHNSSSTN